MEQESHILVFPIPAGGIVPNETGSNLWFESGVISGRVINLCGLWVAEADLLFGWSQLHKSIGRAFVCRFLVETVRRCGYSAASPMDFAAVFAGTAKEMVYWASSDSFEASDPPIWENSATISPVFEFSEGSADAENTFGEWVIEGDGDWFKNWLLTTQFVQSQDAIFNSFWHFAATGQIEVSGRFPDAISERRIIDPDVFLAGGELIAGSSKIFIGESPIWNTLIRLNPNLALDGMMSDQEAYIRGNTASPKAISDLTLMGWLQEFLTANNRKATRDEALSSLNDRYTSRSIRNSYAGQPKHLKRSRSEKIK